MRLQKRKAEKQNEGLPRPNKILASDVVEPSGEVRKMKSKEARGLNVFCNSPGE